MSNDTNDINDHNLYTFSSLTLFQSPTSLSVLFKRRKKRLGSKAALFATDVVVLEEIYIYIYTVYLERCIMASFINESKR